MALHFFSSLFCWVLPSFEFLSFPFYSIRLLHSLYTSLYAAASSRATLLAAAIAIRFCFIFVHFRLLRFRSNYFRCSRTLGAQHTLA